MANEVEVVEKAEIQEAKDVTPTPSYNKNIGEKVIRISIKCKRIKDDKVDFNSVKGMMNLTVIDEDGTNIGRHNRWLDMHFMKKGVFNTLAKDFEISSPEDLKTGYIYVKAKDIQAPRRYQILVDEETGEIKYPSIWIKGDIQAFEPLVASQDAFDYVEEPKENVVATLTHEEEDTEETKI